MLIYTAVIFDVVFCFDLFVCFPPVFTRIVFRMFFRVFFACSRLPPAPIASAMGKYINFIPRRGRFQTESASVCGRLRGGGFPKISEDIMDGKQIDW